MQVSVCFHNLVTYARMFVRWLVGWLVGWLVNTYHGPTAKLVLKLRYMAPQKMPQNKITTTKSNCGFPLACHLTRR
jgi:hypothetical protein